MIIHNETVLAADVRTRNAANEAWSIKQRDGNVPIKRLRSIATAHNVQVVEILRELKKSGLLPESEDSWM